MPWIETSMEPQGTIFPHQHHRASEGAGETPKWPLDNRACRMGVRLIGRKLPVEDRSRGELGEWVEEPGTGGDELGMFLWEADPDSKYRKIPAWSFLFPVVKEPPKKATSGPNVIELDSQGGKGAGVGDAFKPIVHDEKDVKAGNVLSPSKHFVQHTPPRQS